jgi:hypothetical protein
MIYACLLEGKSQNSAVQNLCFLTRKKNRPTVGTDADRRQVKKKTVKHKAVLFTQLVYKVEKENKKEKE